MDNQSERTRKILLVLTGDAVPDAAALAGDFTAMFRAPFGEAGDELEPVDIRDRDEDAAPLDVGDCAGVIMTGSAAMVGDDAPWMRFAVRQVQRWLDEEVPFLGVCFGHQILGLAVGADVGPNPRGREMGTVEVRKLSAARSDALFSAFPDPFEAQVSHRDAILDPGPRLTVLASAPHDPHHIVRYGESAWGVQYHPEFSAPVMRAYIEARRATLDDERGRGTADQRLAGVQDCKVAPQTLTAFADLAQRRRNQA